MKFIELDLSGAYLVEPERLEDKRGFFARLWCAQEFAAHGLETQLGQSSVVFNRRKGTLRGFHYQADPYWETKLVRCTRGSAFYAAIDLRESSPDFARHLTITLDAESRRMLYLPKGFAAGFQTLEDNTEFMYSMSESYKPAYAKGIRWNDSRLGVAWPIAEVILSERDQNLPLLSQMESLVCA